MVLAARASHRAPVAARGPAPIPPCTPPAACRRSANQALFSVEGDEGAEGLAPAAVNAALAVLEVALGRPLFPIRLRPAELPGCGAPASGPCAVWEASTGRLWLDRRILRRADGVPGLGALVSAFATRLVEALPTAAAEVRAVWVGPERGVGVLGDHAGVQPAAGVSGAGLAASDGLRVAVARPAPCPGR